ncbi:MAG: class III signal peptide-containing protein [Candidatus Diapherotrites archaeon]|nr:class III signal peptide-containing protein [Candidatus Diapherotrites archaeon]
MRTMRVGDGEIDKKFEKQRAQISIEFIIIIAAVVAVVLILVNWMQKTAEKGTEKMSKKADEVFKVIDQIE